MKDEIHIGKIIHQKLKEEERTVSWLARKLHCDRSNVYKIFKKSNVDLHLLLKISNIFEYDFFKLLSEKINDNEE
jgi:plasmid maintenance system antidote protein VapI